MFKRFLIAFCIILTVTGAIYVAAIVGLVRGLMQADPYPPFMANYQLKATGTYVQAERAFSEFVSGTFPIGANAKQAVALLSSQGFDILSSTPASFQLLWARHAGPCSERYSIAIRQSEDGSIVEAKGQLHPVCL
jgi:hypothetical protein